MNKCVFIICWFGKLPSYFPVWLKSAEYNSQYDYMILSDAKYNGRLPKNVYIIEYTFSKFKNRASEVLKTKISINKAYRVCDFRPMFGLIFSDYIKEYSYWGFCDLDLVFGNIESALPQDQIERYEAIFNGGHFTLLKNTEKMNNLFRKDGALFDYQTVVKKDAIFAFDETTGIQMISRRNNISAWWGVPYVDADSKYTQLRSRMDRKNPDYQVFYWENGTLYRVKYEDEKFFYQKIVYIHLQKRKIEILDNDVIGAQAFWIEPEGFRTKKYIGLPEADDILKHNSFQGEKYLKKESFLYNIRNMKELFGRGFYSIYVRIKQQKAGINDKDRREDSVQWVRY